ncbi:MAG: hypothetical protein M1522_09925, partial [Actinobacteria bacterium]|nr:hypothetical protein [Actinomycetota bacterium]
PDDRRARGRLSFCPFHFFVALPEALSVPRVSIRRKAAACDGVAYQNPLDISVTTDRPPLEGPWYVPGLTGTVPTRGWAVKAPLAHSWRPHEAPAVEGVILYRYKAVAGPVPIRWQDLRRWRSCALAPQVLEVTPPARMQPRRRRPYG